MQKTIKLINVLLIVVMLCFSLSTVVRAGSDTAPSGKPTPDSVIADMDSSHAADTSGISKIGGQIADILTTIGIVVAVIVILILGIKYMMGSASEKAEYKKTMIPYVVGAVLILGGSAIVKIVFGALQITTPE